MCESGAIFWHVEGEYAHAAFPAELPSLCPRQVIAVFTGQAPLRLCNIIRLKSGLGASDKSLVIDNYWNYIFTSKSF
jgi:hypothetical protein